MLRLCREVADTTTLHARFMARNSNYSNELAEVCSGTAKNALRNVSVTMLNTARFAPTCSANAQNPAEIDAFLIKKQNQNYSQSNNILKKNTAKR